jgi:geranylgeranyl diphosphate synthase, type I
MQLPHVMNKYRSAIDAELRAVLEPYRLPLYDMMRYHLGWIDEEGKELFNSSGKALRPTLCLMSAEAVGQDYRRALPAAAALELVHNFSLIHDDIQDDDAERRHRRTVWKIWGKPQAINAGSAMRVLSNVALARARDGGIGDEKFQLMQTILDETTLSLIEGQYLDIQFEGRFDITVEDYLTMIRGKTASLISCSLVLGALSGTDDPGTLDLFRQLGENLGVGFQIRDDILGIWGDQKETGKPKGSDIMRKKKTLPIVMALSQGSQKVREEITRIFMKERIAPEDVETVFGALNGENAQSLVQQMVQKCSENSVRLIRAIGMEGDNKIDFEQTVKFLTVRNY